MKAGNGCFNWRPVVGVFAVGFLACGLALNASPPQSDGLVRGGTGIPSGIDLPIAPPVYAYRTQTVIEREGGGELPLSYGGDPYKAVGTIAGGVGCGFDWHCDDCNSCTVDTCDLSGGGTVGTCLNTSADTCTSCDDPVFCNGLERCNTHGNCVSDGIDPCGADPTTLCNEAGGPNGTGACETICQDNTDCPDNGDYCDGTESCVLLQCVGGIAEGTACVDDSPCTGGFCGGVCRSSGSPCGEGAVCFEETNTCGNGRCCVPDGGNPGEYICTRETQLDCLAGGGSWLGIGDRAGTPDDDGDCLVAGPAEPNAGEDTGCPKYASGIAVGGVVQVVGPIGVAACNAYQEVGDDYEISNSATDDYIRITTVRLVWGWDTVGIQGNPTRIRITFYDAAGNFVEDTITNAAGGSGGLAVRTIIFSEEPVVPANGFMTVKPAARFSPFSKHYWATTTAPDVGSNDPNVTWFGSGATDASWLGGDPGVFAFELIGEKVPAPNGACCNTSTGACDLQLPWVCENAGNFYQGIGTYCQACTNNLLQSCTSDADCPTCVGGSNPGEACPNGNECLGGGTCSGTATCETVPPACLVSACCNTADGACATVLGGLCEDNSTACFGNDDCIGIGGGTCSPGCVVTYGAGWEPAGFGTSCEPNCCVQPEFGTVNETGGDTCDTAVVQVISVPPPGDPPVTITLSGDNANATFNDRVGDGTGTCESGLHDPNGATQDRGWWEAFSIDACAYVRLDLCCTNELSGEIKQPQWSFIRDGCNPCGTALGNSILPAPIGNELSANDRGAPFCNSDDLWQTYGPLLPGTYYHNIYSAPTGTFGQYQMHITVAACPEAACCLPDTMCIDGATENIQFDVGGLPITCNVDGDCPAGGVCRTCASANQVDCANAGGFWNGFGNLPADTDPIVSCAGAPCERGSCCQGAGECEDRANPNNECNPAQPLTCMSRSQCENGGGTFQGGERCDFPTPPCPTCAVQGLGNCQFPPNNFTDPSDLSMPPNGTVSADDFIPEGDTIETVCVWGAYQDWTLSGASTPYECFGQYGPDVFRVRIYEDNNGLPGTMVPGAERTVSGALVSRGEEPGQFWDLTFVTFPLQAYNLVMDPPITGLVSGEKYWLEVANGADRAVDEFRLSGNTCWWNWAQHIAADDRDEFGARGTDDRSIGGNPAVPGSGYIVGSGHHSDRAFCLGISQSDPLNFAIPDPPIGGCFNCGDETCSPQTQVDCVAQVGVWKQDDPTCAQPFSIQQGDVCGTAAGAVAGNVCSGGVPNGVLDPGEQCDDGDDSDPLDGCVGCLLECLPSAPPGGGPIIIPEDGIYAFDTSCADTDGAPTVTDEQGRTSAFGKDIWFQYTTTATGRLFASNCPQGNYVGRANGFDGFISMYHDVNNPGDCVCPGPTGSSFLASDESCNGVSDAGPGFVSTIVFPNECYLIRVGGWNSAFGQGLLDIGTIEQSCYPSQAPEVEQILSLDSLKNRYLSVSNPNNPAGKNMTYRVTLVDLPAPYDVWNGAHLYAGTPSLVSENGSVVNPIPGFPNFYAAPLVCDLGSAHYADWEADYGTVHFYHEGIVPGGTYDVQVIDDSCTGSSENDYSSPATILNPRWCDLVGAFNVGAQLWSAPNGSVDVAADVVAILDKFSSAPGAPTKARADLEPRTLDFKINITDATVALDAFSGAPYPYSPSVGNPCP